MIPYITASRRENTIDCNVDFIIKDNSKLVMASLLDIPGRVKKVMADLIGNGSITLKDRENIYYNENISSWNEKYRYKLLKHSKTLTHGIVFNTDKDKYCFDWEGKGLVYSLSLYLKNNRYLPITEEITSKLLEVAGIENIVTECQVYTNQSNMSHVKAWNITYNSTIQHYLKKIEVSDSDDFSWEEINEITDYLIQFAEPIKNKLKENINIMYHENNVNPNINNNLKLYDGQIPIVQGGIETLKRKNNRFLYLAAQQGSGKTIMGTKINHLYHDEKDKSTYCTLVVAPAITLKQWKNEIISVVGKNVDVIIIKKTDEFIKFYNETNLKVDKPTYILVGKETFKLSYQKKHGVIPKRMKMKVKQKNERWGWEETVTKELEVCVCPDCGKPIQNTLRKTEDVFFTEKDFSKPKKSNYKCNHCDTVLFQAEYNKTKKTSVIDFIKRKKVIFDSVVIDEAHEGNNFDSIIGMATRDVMRRSKKVILLSGTVSNGYASSIFNILYALIPRQLKKDNVFDKEKFVKTYGTLMAVTKRKDSEYYSSSRMREKESDYQEIEGINPLVFTKYFANNFIFAELTDIRKDLPELKENYVAIDHITEMKFNENRLINDIKAANAFNASFYNDSVVKHYSNNPFNWSPIPIEKADITKHVQPVNIEEVTLPKENKLIEICKLEKENNRKTWIYCDFVNSSQYTEGESLQDRLKNKLQEAGLSVFMLKASVSPIDRKDTIDKNKDKYDVFISHPKLISVGVNLQFCTNYIFYTPTYHVNIVRQAMRRGLRANSTENNHIYHLYYKDGIEAGIMERYKLKRSESESIEAKFIDIDVKRTASELGSKIESKIKQIN